MMSPPQKEVEEMKTEKEIRKQYKEVLEELEREPSERTKGYKDALEWVLEE